MYPRKVFAPTSPFPPELKTLAVLSARINLVSIVGPNRLTRSRQSVVLCRVPKLFGNEHAGSEEVGSKQAVNVCNARYLKIQVLFATP